jgi:hypothetical protein
MRANFRAFLTEGGVLVPGSVRGGHNVITARGREWLAHLVAWESITGALDDISFTDLRLRWISVGTGGLIEVPGLLAMAAPVKYDATDYLCPLDPASGRTWITHPVPTSVKYVHSFQNAELPDLISVPAKEAALFVDYYDGSSTLDPSLDTNEPAAYKRIDPPLLKSAAQTLTIEWELRF